LTFFSQNCAFVEAALPATALQFRGQPAANPSRADLLRLMALRKMLNFKLLEGLRCLAVMHGAYLIFPIFPGGLIAKY